MSLKSIKIYLALFLLLAVHFLLGLDTIRSTSPTFDEPVHLIAGYSYLVTGKYYINILDHPPLAEMYNVLPLLYMKPELQAGHPYWQEYKQYSIADIFLYKNKVDAEKMLNSARLMNLALSCLMGIVVFISAAKLYGAESGSLALFLYVFNSNAIANSSVVTNDMSLSLLYFTSIMVFLLWIRKKDFKILLLLSLTTAMAMTVKFPGIMLLFTYLVLLILFYIKDAGSFGLKQFAFSALLFIAGLGLCILIVYRFEYINLYFKGIYKIFSRVQAGQPAFLLGERSLTGWRHYFAVTFVLKTALPLLILMMFCLFLEKKKILRDENIILLLSAALYFIVISFSKKQIGHRYLLPVYPFLFVWVSGIMPYLKTIGPAGRINAKMLLFFLLLIWYAVSCLRIHPWHLGYFNEFVGSPENGYKYLTDSNIDWGQGLKELGKWYRKDGLKGIFLCYFGTGDPHYYGIKYIPGGMVTSLEDELRCGDNITFSKGDRVFFAVSMTNFQSTYYRNGNTFGWLKKYKPCKIIANSILVYDLSSDSALREEFRKFW